MYHIVICDDEPIFLTQISEMIIDILASMGESCEIRKYTSISELKNTLQNTPKSCDILILDIMLGENNGISFALNMMECMKSMAKKPQTNADRIRSMTDEELAKWFDAVTKDVLGGSTWNKKGWLKWLRAESEG